MSIIEKDRKQQVESVDRAKPGDTLPPANFVDAIIRCFKKYADFKGRATKEEFKPFWCLYWLVFFLLYVLLLGSNNDILFGGLLITFQLVVFLPFLAVGTRRLHDIGKSGWWQLIYLIPLGILFGICLYMIDGEGDNKYGKDPESI